MVRGRGIDNVEENGVGSFRVVFVNMSAVAGFSYVFECTGWRGWGVASFCGKNGRLESDFR